MMPLSTFFSLRIFIPCTFVPKTYPKNSLKLPRKAKPQTPQKNTFPLRRSFRRQFVTPASPPPGTDLLCFWAQPAQSRRYPFSLRFRLDFSFHQTPLDDLMRLAPPIAPPPTPTEPFPPVLVLFFFSLSFKYHVSAFGEGVSFFLFWSLLPWFAPVGFFSCKHGPVFDAP